MHQFSFIFTFESIINCIEWSVTRSSGPGGQHVNKTNSAVVCKLDLELLEVPEDVRYLLYKNLENRIIQEHYISVRSESQRDQKQNKDQAIKIILQLLQKALFIPKKRIKTKPTRSSVRKRLDEKTNKSAIKKLRTEKINRDD